MNFEPLNKELDLLSADLCRCFCGNLFELSFCSTDPRIFAFDELLADFDLARVFLEARLGDLCLLCLLCRLPSLQTVDVCFSVSVKSINAPPPCASVIEVLPKIWRPKPIDCHVQMDHGNPFFRIC